jgi:hypothetical protein
MKEVLFRGLKTSGGWIFGYYFKKKNPFSPDGLPEKHCISDLPPFGSEVVPETVGQYTGLKDRNGAKIFEGDILSDGAKEYEVRYLFSGYYCFRKTASGYDATPLQNFFGAFGSGVEVIGNIHERGYST